MIRTSTPHGGPNSTTQRDVTPRYVFTTYQSVSLVGEAFHRTRIQADLLLADEAHRCLAPTYRAVLHDSKIPAEKRLFSTATPVFVRTRQDTPQKYSMDNPAFFGQVAHQMTFRHAVESGLVCDYELVVLNATELGSDLLRAAPDIEWDGRTYDVEQAALALSLNRASQQIGLQRLISYHSQIRKAKAFVVAMRETAALVGTPITVDYVDGEMSIRDRRRILTRLSTQAEGINLVANARCLTEGIDIPALSGVVFSDPKSSHVDVVQAIGRAVRRDMANEKELGFIVVPVFVDAQLNDDLSLTDAFRVVLATVKALREHDESLSDWLDEERSRRSRGMGRRTPPKVRFEGFTSISSQELLEAFQLELVEEASAQFFAWYGRLTNYVEAQGTARVPVDYVDDAAPETLRRLGRWCEKQRSYYRANVLDEQRQHMLEDLDDWSWHVFDDKWVGMLALLSDYEARMGSAAVPDSCVYQGENLGSWVRKQRANFRKGSLPQARIAALNNVPGWEWEPELSRVEAYTNFLLAYLRSGGDPQPRPGTTYEGHDVNKASQNFRQLILSRQRDGKPLRREYADLIAELESLGWSPRPKEDSFEQNVELLEAYASLHPGGLTGVKQRTVWRGEKIGVRIGQYRSRADKLTAQQRLRLEQIEGWSWNANEETWEMGFREAEAWLREHRTSRGAPPAVQRWIRNNKHRLGAGKFDAERSARLENLFALIDP